jgi:alanyl aminopeptidase
VPDRAPASPFRRHALCPLLLLFVIGCAPAPRPSTPARASSPPPAEAPPTGQLPREVRPLGYGLELEIVPSRERFSGHARISVELARPTASIWLHAKGMNVSQAHAELGHASVPASFRQVNDEGLARLDFPQPLPGGRAVLDLVYDAPFDRQLSGLYKVRTEGRDYAFTQFEAVSARQAFPCFDEPAFKTPFEIALTVRSDDVAVSNTPELSAEPAASGMKRVRFVTTKPLPTYLVAFIVGPLDVVQAAPIAATAERARPLPLRGVATRGKGQRLRYALEHVGGLVAELERYFGIAYPYEKLDLIAVPDFSAGAMENAGAITFREWLLMVDPATAPESQRRAYANVTAHELAHHWTGDLVTMRWWDDTWLNEAFATWLASRVVAVVYPEYHAQDAQLSSVIAVMDGDSRVSARKIRQPIASTHDIANAFDGITYQKGAGVLGMFERYLGAEVFRRGMQAYLRAHANGSADAADLLSSLGEAAGKDVAAPMDSFLDQAGVPLLESELRCTEGGAMLHLRQSRYLPAGSQGRREQRWQLPVCVRYEVRGQAHESCTLLTEPEGSLKLEGGCPDWLMPNADGAGYYRWSLPAPDLDKLRMAGFGKLSVREKLSFVDSLRAGFASGALPAEQVLATLPVLAGDADRAVTTAPMELLRFSREHLLPEAARPALDRFARRLYEPRLRLLGWKERASDDGDTKLLRAEIVWFLCQVVRDPATRASAAELGRRYLGLDHHAGSHEPGEVPVDLRTVAVQVAVQNGDQALFDAIYGRLSATTDPTERDRLLSALSSVTDPRSVKAQALSLDPALHVNEAFTPLRYQLGDERTRAAAWDFFEAHFDALVARVGRLHAGGLPGLAVPFCSLKMAERARAFFAPRIEQLAGGPRSLAAAIEALQLCAAQAELQRASAQAFFSAQK